MHRILCKRIYEQADPADGHRLLADRLWPRGVSKQAANLDGWAKELTPSPLLRKRWHEREISWEAFAGEYERQLLEGEGLGKWAERILKILKTQNVTLLTAAHLEPASHLEVLKRVLEREVSAGEKPGAVSPPG